MRSAALLKLLMVPSDSNWIMASVARCSSDCIRVWVLMSSCPERVRCATCSRNASTSRRRFSEGSTGDTRCTGSMLIRRVAAAMSSGGR